MVTYGFEEAYTPYSAGHCPLYMEPIIEYTDGDTRQSSQQSDNRIVNESLETVLYHDGCIFIKIPPLHDNYIYHDLRNN